MAAPSPTWCKALVALHSPLHLVHGPPGRIGLHIDGLAAIANGGKMVKPRFVKAELKDGMVIREFPTEVIKERICKPSTLRDIQFCLEHVVSGDYLDYYARMYGHQA